MGRLLVVADIHGCAKQFLQLLALAGLTQDDTLIILGDFIDRGPESRRMIEILIRLKQKFPKVIVLKGNHEEMLIGTLEETFRLDFYLANGGWTTANDYRNGDGELEFPGEHYRFLKSLKTFHETDDYFFVHAGVRPGVPLSEQTEQDMLWISKDFTEVEYNFGKIIVHGHTSVAVPDIRFYRMNLDTGGVFGGLFTLLDLTNARTYRVEGLESLPTP